MDAGIIGATYFFSWYLRFKSGLFVQDAGVLPAKTYFSALFLIIPGYLLLYSIFQLYMPRRVKSYRKELMDIIRANGIGFMIFILVLYFIKQEHFSRQMLCIFFFSKKAGSEVSSLNAWHATVVPGRFPCITDFTVQPAQP